MTFHQPDKDFCVPGIDGRCLSGPHPPTSPEPEPIPNDLPAVWALVVQDMVARDRVGRDRYGTPLQPHNGRDALKDAYQEALDLAVYLRQAIYERDGR